jgi:hypothetical protein
MPLMFLICNALKGCASKEQNVPNALLEIQCL